VYIRWVVRKHKNASVADMTFHDAYLIESYRDDDGNPRQRTLGYLGNIRQIGEGFPLIERELFLLRADRILASMPELTSADRDEVLQLLRDRVPPLATCEVEEAFRANLRWYYQWWRANGGPPTPEQMLCYIQDAMAGKVDV